MIDEKLQYVHEMLLKLQKDGAFGSSIAVVTDNSGVFIRWPQAAVRIALAAILELAARPLEPEPSASQPSPEDAELRKLLMDFFGCLYANRRHYADGYCRLDYGSIAWNQAMQICERLGIGEGEVVPDMPSPPQVNEELAQEIREFFSECYKETILSQWMEPDFGIVLEMRIPAQSEQGRRLGRILQAGADIFAPKEEPEPAPLLDRMAEAIVALSDPFADQADFDTASGLLAEYKKQKSKS